MSMENLRQGSQNIRNSSGKGPQRAAFYARWKPPAMKDPLVNFLAAAPNEEAYLQISEPVVIIPGKYPDPYMRNADGTPVLPVQEIEALHFRAHTFPVFVKPKNGAGFQTFRDMVCSAGPDPHAAQQCIGCNQADHGNKDAKPKDQWAFNIAHLAWYHSSPLMKDGQVQMKKDNSGPILVKNQCANQRMENIVLTRAAQARAQGFRAPKACEGCQQGHPFVFGDHRVIQVGKKHLDNILDLDVELGKRCANCGTNLLLLYFDCGKCSEHMVDLASSGWTNAQIAEFGKSQQQCSKCQTVGQFVPYYECGYDERYAKIAGAGCGSDIEPIKGSIFDNVLWLQREGEKTETEFAVKKQELISQFKTPDGRPLADHLAEVVKAPFNLAEMYSPESLDDQAAMINIPNPYAAQQPQFQQYSQYGGQPQQPQQPQGFGPPQQGGYAPPQQNFGPPTTQQPQYPGMPQPGRPNYGK